MATTRTGREGEPTNGRRQTTLPVPARRGDGRARVVTPLTDTVKTQYSTLPEMFTPNWDALIASEQQMRRNQDRARMGQKRTPRGAGRLKPAI